MQDWTEYDHPQLGKVEIGGLDTKRCIQNPPPALLEKECEKNTAFSLALLGSLPAVEANLSAQPLSHEQVRPSITWHNYATWSPIDSSLINLTRCMRRICNLQEGGDGALRVTLQLRNTGFLPTYGAQRGIATKAVREHGIATLNMGNSLTLVYGDRIVEVPHLSGRASAFDSESPVASSYGASPANTHEITMEWIVQGHGVLDVEVDFQRGGMHRCSLQIGDATSKL